jgi:hypothetical protein
VPNDSAVHPTGDLVLTLDGDTADEGPIRYAFEQADARDAVLHVLHVTPADTPTYEADQIRANVSEVLAGWLDEYPDINVVKGFSIGDPTDSITRATDNAALGDRRATARPPPSPAGEASLGDRGPAPGPLPSGDRAPDVRRRVTRTLWIRSAVSCSAAPDGSGS